MIKQRIENVEVSPTYWTRPGEEKKKKIPPFITKYLNLQVNTYFIYVIVSCLDNQVGEMKINKILLN